MRAHYSRHIQRFGVGIILFVATSVSLTLSACSTAVPLAAGQVTAIVTIIADNPDNGGKSVFGEIENGTMNEVRAVVMRLGAYDSANVRLRSLYATGGPLVPGARARFTLSCQSQCQDVRVESIEHFE